MTLTLTLASKHSLPLGLYGSACAGNLKYIGRNIHAGQKLHVEHDPRPVHSDGLQEYLGILDVEQDCSDTELKEAYLKKAKAYHPDSATVTADPYKFSQVKDAYRALMKHRKGRDLIEEEEKEAEIIFDIKHTAPQHRQYLEFEGIGCGTPSQRQKQYQQHRVARVTENVFQHRIQKLAAETEDALVVKDKQQAKKIIISNAIDRIVEDLIQESMKRGDFNNLPGQGQPLAHLAHNPFVDITTHNINKILVNNGFAPEWIMLQSEIRKEMLQARQILALNHKKLGDKHSSQNAKEWTASLNKFRQQVGEINIKINKFNLIVPFLDKQKMPYNTDREVKRVLENVQEYLPEDRGATLTGNMPLTEVPLPLSQQNIDWQQVWNDIKGVFRSPNNQEQN